MSKPIFYYANLFARGTLSGSSPDSTNPVRRVSDSDRTMKYDLLTSAGPSPTSGQVQVTLGTADSRDYFVMVRGTTLSGWTCSVESEDVGGGNNATHGSQVLSGDSSFVLALSGVSTARRVWRARFVSASGVTTVPSLYEMMLAKRYQLPQSPIIGVSRTRVQNFQRLDVPGAAPFKLRLGEDFKLTTYQVVLTESETSGFVSFIQENDGGEPFWFTDDLGSSYWAELRNAETEFDDQAGVYTFRLAVQEIPLET